LEVKAREMRMLDKRGEGGNDDGKYGNTGEATREA